MAKMVLIADGASIWTKRYVEYLAIDLFDNITIISMNDFKFVDYYKSVKVKLIVISRIESRIDSIPKMRGFLNVKRVSDLVKKEEPDVLHVMQPNAMLLFYLGFQKMEYKTIVTYIGSDLFRQSKNKLMLESRFINKTNEIILMTDEMAEEFQRIFGDRYSGKLNIIDFGAENLKLLSELSFEEYESKKTRFLEDAGEKIVITLGYNSMPQQQHISVISQLAMLSAEEKNNIYVICPMTYGAGDIDYINEVENALTSINIDCCVLKEYMSGEDMMRLWLRTDIYINAQTTDAISTSILELLCADTILLSGKWLRYSFLDRLGIQYWKFTAIDEISELLKDVLNNKADYKKSVVHNRNILMNECSWEKSKEKWNKVYSRMNII